MKPSFIFNPNGSDEIGDRQLWNGNTTNLICLNETRYTWATSLYQQMRENFWIPQKLDLSNDANDWNLLTPAERTAFEGILSYLVFLDSVQTVNIPHLKIKITAPEINLCIVEQLSQEALHSASYQWIIESIIPAERRNTIYNIWRTDGVLYHRCQWIAELYQQYLNDPTVDNYVTSLLANYLLESIYFYNGFIFFYNLASRQLMSGTCDVMRLINRDELSHVRLYQNLVKEALQTLCPSYPTTMIYQMLDNTVQQEINWATHIIGNDILGLTPEAIANYTKYLANIRIKAIGFEPLYPEVKKDPFAHLSKFADTKKEGYTKANFFESNVCSYNLASTVTNWNF